MKILFWVPYPADGPSNRYRVEQYLPYLEKAGICYSLRPFWSKSAFKILYKNGHKLRKIYFFLNGTVGRIYDLMRIIRYDVVFIHRETYPVGGAFFEKLLLIMKKPFIFDFDDAIFLPASSCSNDFVERFKRPDKVARIAALSRQVIAGNGYLADFASRHSHSVSVIPTSIDTDKYYTDEDKRNGEVVIGWIGSVTTLNFLNIIRNVFIRLSRRFRHIKFKVVGGDFSINGLANVSSKPWSLREEIEDLKSFDIGIMPMPDNQWTRGKCGFKAILYMSMGVVCVCSPVGVNKEIITDGVNGFLAATEDQWFEKLSLLVENPCIRKTAGIAGRKTVEEKFSVRANAPKFLEIINKTYKESRKR